MPGSDPSDETGTMKMAYNATAEKPGAAKYGHVQRHDAKVSRQLRLSHSHSTGDQSRHRTGASQKALVSQQGMISVDTSSIESTVVYNVRQPGTLLPEDGRRSFILKSDRRALLRPRGRRIQRPADLLFCRTKTIGSCMGIRQFSLPSLAQYLNPKRFLVMPPWQLAAYVIFRARRLPCAIR
jgi:hypothetical protein